MAVVINLPPLPINRLDSVSTIAQLRALPSAAISDGADVVVDGGDLSGDGLGGLYTWSELSVLPDNGSNVIRPNDTPPLSAGRWILTGGGLVRFVQDGTDAVSRTLLDKAREILSPADFGVKADGSDTSVAWGKFVSYVNSLPGAMVLLPAGDIRLVGTVYSFTTNVTLMGRGSGVTRFMMDNNARLRFIGTRQGPFNRQFTLSDFSVLTNNIHSSSPLYVDYIEQGTVEPSLTPTLQMRNILVAGQTTANGFTNGLELVDCPWPKLDNVVFRGDNAYLSGMGIRYTGAHGSASFTRVRGIYLKDFIWCLGQMEGYDFQDVECLAVQRGLTVSDNTNGLQPLLTIKDSHLNCEEYCIKTLGMDYVTIDESVNLYGTQAMGAATIWTGVDVTPTAASGADNSVVCNGTIRPTVNGPGAFAINTIGVRIRGNMVAIEHYNVGGSYTGPLSTGIQLDANTNGVMVEQNTKMINVVLPCSNSGNNIVLLYGFFYQVAALPNASTFRPLGNIRLVVSDAAGGATFNTTAVGGGAIEAPVYRGLTDWKIG